MYRQVWKHALGALLAVMMVSACGSSSGNDNEQKGGEDQKITSAELLYLNGFKYKASDINITATRTTDRHGKKLAYHFDGINNKDMIAIAHDDKFNITETITLAAWVKIAQNNSGVIVRKSARATNLQYPDPNGCPYSLSISQTGDVILSLNLGKNGNYTWTQLRHGGYPINKWMHVAGTYDGSSMKLYIDGKLEEEQSASGTMSTNTDPLYIGTRGGYSTWNGDISDVHIYSKAFTDKEIADLAKQ